MTKSNPDVLIVQGGSVDITNLKTKGNNPEKYGEYFKQEAIMSATQVFTSVCNALNGNPNLKKVILMKQIPRYDLASNDPKCIKAALSQLYNDTLTQLWLSSPLKDRLTIGTHSLECYGGIRESRYRHRERYDGVHLYGPSGKKSYTESVLRIIKDAGYIMNTPPTYFRMYHKIDGQTKSAAQTEYKCPTQDTHNCQNDQDIRHGKRGNHSAQNKQNGNYNDQYTVPTSNRYETLNQGNY